jgi:hypothetical protein
MMAITHGLAGVALASLLLPLGPEYAAPPLLVAAFLGGVAPDVDVFADHRKTLHFPVGFAALAVGLAGAYVVVPSAPLWLACVAVASAAVHSLSDILAGSVEREPWNPTTERAVYNHVLGAWHRPRRYVRYSGAVEDLLLALVCGGFAVAAPITGPTADRLLIATVAFAAAYVVVRHPSVSTDWVLNRLPRRLLAGLPTISVEETESGTTTVSIRGR